MGEEKNIYEHLEEARIRVIKSLFAVVIFSILAYILRNKIFLFLAKPLGKELFFLSPTEALVTMIKLSIIVGFIIAFPYIIYQIWGFFSIVFDKNKRKSIIKYITASIFLFYGALVFCYFLVLPTALKFLINFENIPLIANITFQNYINFSLFLLISFGIIFQFPIVLIALINFNFVSVNSLRKNRHYVILVIFICAAIITPTSDAITLFLLVIPLILLFEISLIIAKFKAKTS